MEAQPRPKVLVVYYSFSHQTERVADVIVDELGKRGAEVTKAPIAFTDKRWAARFEKAPDAIAVDQDRGHAPGSAPACDR